MESEKPGPEGPQGRSLGQGWHLGVRGSGEYSPPSSPAPWSLPRWRAYLAAAVLCYINLLNYMNWFIIAGEAPAHLPPTSPLAAQPPAGALYVQSPSVQQTFFLGSIFLLFFPQGWFQPCLNGGRAS